MKTELREAIDLWWTDGPKIKWQSSAAAPLAKCVVEALGITREMVMGLKEMARATEEMARGVAMTCIEAHDCKRAAAILTALLDLADE